MKKHVMIIFGFLILSCAKTVSVEQPSFLYQNWKRVTEVAHDSNIPGNRLLFDLKKNMCSFDNQIWYHIIANDTVLLIQSHNAKQLYHVVYNDSSLILKPLYSTKPVAIVFEIM